MTQFPVPNPTLPFWRTELHDLDNHRTTEQLPAEVDIVIIGAGYAGASIAYHLVEKTKASGKPVSIAILEAREACSGATGRNGKITSPHVKGQVANILSPGGHLKPDPYYRAASALRKYGKEAAEEVASFEQRQVKAVKELVEKENIDCDFVVTRATDVCLYEEIRKELKEGLEQLKEAGISTASEVHYSDGRTAEVVRKINPTFKA